MIHEINKFVEKLWGGYQEFREYFSSDHFGDAAAFWFILGFVKGSSLREPEEKGYLLRHLAAFSDGGVYAARGGGAGHFVGR